MADSLPAPVVTPKTARRAEAAVLAAVPVEKKGEALDALTAGTIELYHRRRAESTCRAYASDMVIFTKWCDIWGFRALPAEPSTVARFITAHVLVETEAPHAASTLDRRLAAIRAAHLDSGHPSPTDHPTVASVRQGARRTVGVRPRRQVEAITIDELRLVLEAIDGSRGIIDVRDRALLLTAFTGAFRRSEVAELDVEDLTRNRRGYTVLLRESKGDQEAEGFDKGLPKGTPPTCPVTALDAWIKASGITEGALFRSITRKGRIDGRLSDKSVARIIKRRAAAVGIDPAAVAGHSLRAGAVTTLARNDVPVHEIMRLTGHRNERTVGKYIRREHVLGKNGPAGKLGL